MSPATEGRLPFSIVPIAAAHREDWDALYEAYANFYRSTQTKEMRQRVWGWLNDETHELEGRIAVDANGRGVGLVHYRPFTRPLAAATAGYIDDLFVAPDRRGHGIAEALIETVAAEGRRRGWVMLRWMTAEDNYRARALYDRVADRTAWLTYQIPLK